MPEGVEDSFISQADQLGLGHAVLYPQSEVNNDPFSILLADDFLTDNAPGPGVNTD